MIFGFRYGARARLIGALTEAGERGSIRGLFWCVIGFFWCPGQLIGLVCSISSWAPRLTSALSLELAVTIGYNRLQSTAHLSAILGATGCAVVKATAPALKNADRYYQLLDLHCSSKGRRGHHEEGRKQTVHKGQGTVMDRPLLSAIRPPLLVDLRYNQILDLHWSLTTLLERASRMKYFWACVRTCVALRVPT